MSSAQVATGRNRASTDDGYGFTNGNCEPIRDRAASVMSPGATAQPRLSCGSTSSFQAKTRRVSLGVAFINRLSGTVIASRRTSNVPSVNSDASTTGGGRENPDARPARRRSEATLTTLPVNLRCNSDSGVGMNTRDSSMQCSAISTMQALAIEKELLDEYGFSADQLTELAGLASATAFTCAYPRETLTKNHGSVLILCGPSENGCYGLVCARYLQHYGYQPTIYCPIAAESRQLKKLQQQCEKFEISSLAYLPKDVNLIKHTFNVLIDAITGLKYPSKDVDAYQPVLRTLRGSALPVLSIDVPCGWHAEKGPLDADAIQPDVLVSLTAPKKCALLFTGRKHFLGGRFVPRLLAQKYGLKFPDDTGSALIVDLPSDACIDVKPSIPTIITSSDDSKPNANEIWGAT